MKLQLISEIQRKSPTTNLDRSNVTGVYGVASINDFFHLIHDGDGHGQSEESEDEIEEIDKNVE